jgi:YidC/Oxa1 family membrane protein insertase
MSFLNPLYEAVAWLVVHIHSGMAHIFGASSGWSWAVSIILLTIAMRLVLFPLFVKQIRSQRAMQVLQPQMKALQAKYKNDKERLNQEMMKLWREAGVNPLAGCLPLILQIPIFIALWHVLDSIKPDSHGHFNAVGGVSYSIFPHDLIAQAAHAKIFGVPIASAFNSSSHTLALLHASSTSTKVFCGVLTIVMVVTTFITQRQLMARNAANGTTEIATQQKVLLYVFPLFFLIYGYRFPVGVLLYWLTSNLWSMGQQLIVIRRMEAAPAAAAAAPTPAGPAPGAKPSQQVKAKAPAQTTPAGAPAPAPPAASPATPPADGQPSSNGGGVRPAGQDIVLPPGGAMLPTAARPAAARRPNNRSKKRKKRGRR